MALVPRGLRHVEGEVLTRNKRLILNALLIEVVSVIHDTCPCDPSSGSGPKNRDFRRISFPVLFAKLSFIWAWRSLLTIFNASRRRTP